MVLVIDEARVSSKESSPCQKDDATSWRTCQRVAVRASFRRLSFRKGMAMMSY